MVPEDKSTRVEEAVVVLTEVIKLRRASVGPIGIVISIVDTYFSASANIDCNCTQV